MTARRRSAALAALVALALLAPLARHAAGGPAAGGASGPSSSFAQAPADPSAGTYAFDAGVSAVNRRAFAASAARVRPEARRLFDRVDALVRVVDGPVAEGTLAVTTARPGGYTITLPLGAVFQRLGQRGFDRVVAHELAHVVDFALVPADVDRRLDAGIPPGQPCAPGASSGSCAPREERFAETFAKWASGDIGVELYAGYAVPPPPDLEAWGAPLARLG